MPRSGGIARVAGLGQEFVDTLIDRQACADDARRAAFEELAKRSSQPLHTAHTLVEVGPSHDDPVTRRLDGRHAIGAPVPEPAPVVAKNAQVAPDLPVAPELAHGAPVALTVVEKESPVTPRQRPETKQAKLIAMLQRPEGATLDQIVEATGWRRHTIRGAISGTLRKKLGLTIVSQRIESKTLYRIIDTSSDAFPTG